MPFEDHKIQKSINNKDFLDLMSNYKEEDVFCTDHTLFRLNGRQRKLFKCKELKEYILNEIPLSVGIQGNKKYAVFYNYKNNYIIRMILDLQIRKIEIVTFYIISSKNITRL